MAKAKEAERAALPPLVITPEKGLPVDGNFQAILGYLTLREKEVAKMKLSEDNLEQAKLIKKEAGAYRKAVEERLKTAIALLFDGPKDVLKSKAQELFKAIERIESAAGAAIDKVEEDRVADLNQAFEAYKTTFQEVYQLDERRLGLIELRKWYYNKTPPGNEKKAKDDLERQYQDLKKEQDDYAADVLLIRGLCADEPRLNEQAWVNRLDRISASVIAGEIAAEKARLAELDKPKPEDPGSEEDDDVGVAAYAPVLAPSASSSSFSGTAISVSGSGSGSTDSVLDRIAAFEADFPGRTSKRSFELEYPCEMGDLITELFKELRRSKIVARLIKAEAVA
jgi:hypothetical protein